MLPPVDIRRYRDPLVGSTAADVCLVLMFLLGGSVVVSSLPVLLEGLRWLGILAVVAAGILLLGRSADWDVAKLAVAGMTLAFLPLIVRPAPMAVEVFLPVAAGWAVACLAPGLLRRGAERLRRTGARPVPVAGLGIALIAMGVAMGASG